MPVTPLSKLLEKVVEEARASFKSGNDITLALVSCLAYMLAYLNETLRSYPSVPFGYASFRP